MQDELAELLDLVGDRIEHRPRAVTSERLADAPLWVHATYSREELLAGLGQATLARRPTSDMQGVRFVEPVPADVFTFTLRKSEKKYSPTTMYRDYAISQDLVHWESQNTTSVESPTGQRYLHHRQRGTSVLLFVRESETDEIGTSPFLFLGPASYVTHEGSRPIAITWKLDHPMPVDFFTRARLLAG